MVGSSDWNGLRPIYGAGVIASAGIAGALPWESFTGTWWTLSDTGHGCIHCVLARRTAYYRASYVLRHAVVVHV